MTKLEKETVILFNEAEPDADIYTHNLRLGNRLEKLAEKHPDTIIRLKEDQNGGVFWRVPKRLVQVRAPWDEQRREAARERLTSFSADKTPPQKDGLMDAGGLSGSPH